MNEEIPYVAFGNDELDNAPPVTETVKCEICGEQHPVEYGDKILPDGTKEPSKVLGFYKCGGKTYLASVAGKLVITQ